MWGYLTEIGERKVASRDEADNSGIDEVIQFTTVRRTPMIKSKSQKNRSKFLL